MRFSIILAIVTGIVSLLLDWYIYHIIKTRTNKSSSHASCYYAIVAIITYIVLIIAICLPRASASNGYLVADMWMIYTFITTLVARLGFCIFDWLSLILRRLSLKWGHYLTYTGIGLAITLFGVTWWGALINRNRISVIYQDIPSSMWPVSFDGFTIAQISDLHVGTWGNNTHFFNKLVDHVNSLSPDMIVFTGDIVSRESEEFIPMVETFARLNAPYGVYAIMGNHDYGDYKRWDDEKEHKADRLKLKQLYDLTGHKLLLNETVWIKHANDSIALIGVENIGDPPFHTYGNLNIAYQDCSDSLPKILLTHNPAHWVKDIKNNPDINIPLTLSGHTHAMQIQIAGHTPASWRYPTAWGLYTDSLGHYLYVNRGAGTVGMPMRIGATPEITILHLQSLADK